MPSHKRGCRAGRRKHEWNNSSEIKTEISTNPATTWAEIARRANTQQNNNANAWGADKPKPTNISQANAPTTWADIVRREKPKNEKQKKIITREDFGTKLRPSIN